MKLSDDRRRWLWSRRHRAGLRSGLGPVAVLAACVLAVGLGSAPAAAAARAIDIQITVALLSPEPGKVDPRGKKLLAELSSQLRFESLRVIEQRQLSLEIDDVGGVTLPNGHLVRIKPLLLDQQGALLAVEMEGSLDTQLRVRSGHLVVLGPQRYQGGLLVVAIEPHF